MLPRGQIFYDASCGLCRSAYERYGPMTERRGFSWIPLQEPRARTVLNLEGDEMPGEIKLLTRTGRLLGGVEAILYVAKHVWWAWPLWLLGQFPIIRPTMDLWYRWIAKHRHELSTACGIESKPPTPSRVDRAA